MNHDALSGVIQWLRLFQECVRRRDYETAATLFHSKVVAFGTICQEVTNLDELIEKQWKQRWPINLNFTFQLEQLSIIQCACPNWVIAVKWQTDPILTGGEKRNGRCTLLLRSFEAEKKMLCLHSHFSIDP